MSLDQCIAALAKVERGAIRDIFSPIPTRPEPYSLNLTQEYSRFSVQSDPKSSVPGSGPAGPGKTSPSPTVQQQSSSGSTGDGRFNCGPCKKSFGSEATFHSHQMSAKHIAAVKDADKKNKGKGSSKSGSTNNNNNNNNNARAKQRAEEEEPDHPEVTEALMSLRKVEKIVKENPNMAASVLWKIAKVLWSHRQAQETARVLALLISILSDLQSTTTSATPAQPGSLTPTQISMTLYLSRLSMARLVLYHSPSFAVQCYLDAIQGRWQIPSEEIQHICEMVNTSSQAQILAYTKSFLTTHSKTEKLMQPPPPPAAAPEVAKKPADPNLKLLTVLLEASSMVLQTGAIIHDGKAINKRSGNEDRIMGETALGLLSMAFSLTEAINDTPGAIDLLRTMALIFKSPTIRMPSAAASCLIRAGEISGDHTLTTTEGKADHATENPRAVWDLLQGLLLAAEAGDFVRMRQSIQLLRTISRATPQTRSFQDVDAIVEVAEAVLAQDNDFLHSVAVSSVDHLLLIVNESGNSLADESDLLMCRYSSPLASAAMLEKLQQLIK